MEIQILNSQDFNGFAPIIGDRTIELLDRFAKKLDSDELSTTRDETIEILSYCIDPKQSDPQSITNLVVGYVQSGKTMSFTLLSALAHDNGFRVIIYFAGTKNNLLEQTTKRLRKDLINGNENAAYYKLHENPTLDDVQRISNEFKITTKPTILITVLKKDIHIDHLSEIFQTTAIRSVLKNHGVMIIDDEADQASLNGYAFKNSKSDDWGEDEFTATYKSILALKAALPNHSYIQYTATPQGPLLISILDLLSPKHHKVLTPGKKYTGGKTFFKDEPGLILTIPDNEVYHSKRQDLLVCPQSLKDALILHVMSVAIIVKIKKREPFLSMMVHADKEQDASEKFHGWIKNIIGVWTDMLNVDPQDLAYIDFVREFKSMYPEAIREYQSHGEEYPTFEEIMSQVPDIIYETNLMLVISRNKKKGQTSEIDWDGSISHILVGADMLNRGFTVEKLAVTYMPRHSVGKSTADTIQQRCRFFGYKRNYLYSCRVYLPEDTALEYREYVDHEEEMRKWLNENTDLRKVEKLLLISPSLNATRKNILSKDTVYHKLNGWRKMNAFQNIEANTKFVEEYLDSVSFKLYQPYGTDDRDHRYVKLSIEQAIDFLTNFNFQCAPDAARKQATLRYIQYLTSQENNPMQYVYLIHMAYRNIAGRERAFNPEKKTVNNVHAGHDPKGNHIYPGDSEIKFEDAICIQLHKVKLKSADYRWNGKTAYTLAIYYPKDFAVGYVEPQNIVKKL